MATKGSFFTRGKSSFARTPVPAPAPKPQQMPKAAVAVPAQMPRAAVAAPAVLTTPPNSYNQTQLAELRKADQSLGNVAKSAYSPADLARIQQEQSKAMLQQPQQVSGLKAVAPAAQRFKQQDAFNQSQQSAAQNFNQQAAFNQSQQSAAQRFNQQAPTMSPQAAQQAAAMGPKMPGMKKGGVVKKKPGYAKGGAVAKKTAASKYAKGGMAMPKASNCGASMKPQQRKK